MGRYNQPLSRGAARQALGRSDPIYTTDTGKRLMKRLPEKNPKDAACKTHFKRICGVCAHFPFAAAMRAPAQVCTLRGIAISGMDSAAKCEKWGRKSAPFPAPLNPQKVD